MEKTQEKHFGELLPARPDWLATQASEPALDPELPIIDAHHHLWDIKGEFDPRLGGRSDRYLLNAYSEDIKRSGHKVIGSVYVECRSMYRQDGLPEMRSVGEIEFAGGMAAMAASGQYGPSLVANGIVGYTDLSRGAAARPVLEAMVDASPCHMKGVRFNAGWDPDPTVRPSAGTSGPGRYRDPAVREAIASLRPLDLSLDIFVFHPQLADATELAMEFPDTQFVMGHCGGILGSGTYASQKEEVYAHWKNSMAVLAKCPNVNLKIGGMTIRLAAFDFHTLTKPPNSEELAGHWRRYVETCIELFGANRCMFESNFPVDKMGVSYGTLMNAFKRITSAMSPSEREDLFAGTARRTYRLTA